MNVALSQTREEQEEERVEISINEMSEEYVWSKNSEELCKLWRTVCFNIYTHVGLENAEKELQKMQRLGNARKEIGISNTDDKPLKQNMDVNWWHSGLYGMGAFF